MSILKPVLQIAVLLFVTLIGLVFFFDTSCACSTKEMAYRAAMRSDLRNLVTAEEQVFERDSAYKGSVDSLGLVFSTGVQFASLEVSRDGWRAEVSHRMMPGTCAIYVGSQPADTTYAWRTEGEPVCRGMTLRRPSPWQRLKRKFQ